MKRRRMRAVLTAYASAPPETRRHILSRMEEPLARAVEQAWWAHGGQLEPRAADDGGPWRVWAIVAGRGFGKTRAGAEWIWRRVRRAGPELRIALVGATLDEVERVMVRGESGLLACARPPEKPRWIRSRRLLEFGNGALGFAYSADRPDSLRGPQHHFAWCDELAKWPRGKPGGAPRGEAAWDNLMLGLRLGEAPRTIVTTTPKPGPLISRLRSMPNVATTWGRTDQNPVLAGEYKRAMEALYRGTRLARQELDGELLEDLPGALWTRETLERWRRRVAPRGDELERIVVGVDPPASAGGDACGIVVCGMGPDGIGWVLADLSVAGLRPEGWAARVAAAAEAWGAGRVVAEKNQGGEMVASVLAAAGCPVPVRPVFAGQSKTARAEPIALRFETGEARLAGGFPELEDELCAMTWRGYEGPAGTSPDRADAMVWAMSELFDRRRGEPRVRVL